jgi:hypothetical protein
MFIKYENNNIVNLENVSNVFIDRKNGKVIFNMNYTVKLYDTMTADYEYWYFDNLEEIVSLLDDSLSRAGFITPNNIYNRYVNPKCISSIKIDDRNMKVIYNLNTTVTHPDDARKCSQGDKIPLHKQRLTSDFVFIKFNNADEFYDYCEQIEELVSVI